MLANQFFTLLCRIPTALFIALPLLATAQPSEKSLLQTLNQRIDEAVVKKDLPALKNWYADDFVFTHGTGLVEGKSSWLKTVGDTAVHFIVRAHDSLTVEMHGKTAIVHGKLSVKRGAKNGISAYELWYVRVFVQRKKHWQLVSHRTVSERHLN